MSWRRPLITSLAGVADDTVLTTQDVAAIMCCSSDTAGEMLSTGKIPGMFMWGSRYRIYAKDLKRHIESQKVGYRGPLADLEQPRRGRSRERAS